MWLVYIFLFLCTAQIGCFVPAFFLLIALELFLQFAQVSLSFQEMLLLVSIILAVPLTALMSAFLLEYWLGKYSMGRGLQTFAVTLAFALALSSGKIVDFLEVALELVQRDALVSQALLFTSLISSVIFCAGLVCFVCVSVHLAFELPMRWLLKAGKFRTGIPYAGLRPLSIVLVLSLAMNHIIGLFGEELWPTQLLRY